MAKPLPKKRAPRPVVAYEPKGYEPKRIYQKIAGVKLFEDLALDPKYLPTLFVDNVILRVLARTCGQGPFGPVPIRCNEDGSLYVAGLGGGYTRHTPHKGNAPDAYGANIVMDIPYGRIDVFTFDNKMYFKRSRDNVVWDDEIEFFKDSFYSFDCVTKAFNIKNYVAGQVARYQIVGWY